MDNPSISMPSRMLDEIENRREKGVNRSEYVREAVQARFDEEDEGTWDGVDVVQPESVAEP